MRNRTIKWKMNIEGHTAHVEISPWEYKCDADHMGHDEDGDATHIELRRLVSLTFSYQGRPELGTRQDHDLWYMTTTQPLTIDESWDLRDHGTLPARTEFELITCGGDQIRAGRTAKSLRQEIKEFCAEIINSPWGGIEYETPPSWYWENKPEPVDSIRIRLVGNVEPTNEI